MTPAQVAHIMALVTAFGNGRATNALNHATDGPASDNIDTAAQFQAIEAALRDAPQAEQMCACRSLRFKQCGQQVATPSAATAVEPDDLHIAYLAGFADGKKARSAVEPVAYSVTSNGRHVGNLYGDIESARTRMEYLNQHWPEDNRAVVPLFATPHTAPVPLSDAEIDKVYYEYSFNTHPQTPPIVWRRGFSRAIERAVLGRGGEK